MFATFAAALLSAAVMQQTDTVISVSRGARLEVENYRGEVIVGAWDRSDLRITADHSSRAFVEITRSPSAVRLRGRLRGGAPTSVSYRITIPRDLSVDIRGTFTDVEAAGAGGELRVETVHGEVSVRGGWRLVGVRSVQGDVSVAGARGRVEVESTNGVIELEDVVGAIAAETVNGGIAMRSVQSDDVQATTVNGGIRYSGSIADNGRYRFENHNGNIVVAIPPNANATIDVSTFSGEFDTAFPVTLVETRRGGRNVTFTLGSGSARLDLVSFAGKIALERRGGN